MMAVVFVNIVGYAIQVCERWEVVNMPPMTKPMTLDGHKPIDLNKQQASYSTNSIVHYDEQPLLTTRLS